MNRFYFKNKNNPQKKCFEVYGIDIFTGIRYSLALCGRRKSAQKALESYLLRIQPYDYYIGTPHQYEGCFLLSKQLLGITLLIGIRNLHNELDYECRIMKNCYLSIVIQTR